MRGSTIMLACLLVAVGCGNRSGEMAGEGSTTTAGLAASLEVKVEVDSVYFTLHVTNDTPRPQTFTFPSSQRYDFVVRTSAGEEVWRWSEGMMFMQALVEAELGAGDTWTFEAAWDPGDRAGVFEATGRLTARDRRIVQQMTFELP